MTQAWNLSQLANKVNTSGQLDASNGLVNATPVANGGTNNASLPVTAGGVLYTDGSKVVNVGAGTAGQVLVSAGASAPTWGGGGGGLNNIQYFTSSGSYTPTANTSFIVVEVVGGGSSGSKGSGGAGAGAGGGYARKKITSAFSGVTVTIGAGGTAVGNGALGTFNGIAGGTSSFGSLISATGGAAPSSAGVATTVGGIGSSGDINITGGNGVAIATIDFITVGGSSPLGFGTGGVCRTVTGVSGTAGVGYGSGGGATSFNHPSTFSGAGSSGIVIVWEYK